MGSNFSISDILQYTAVWAALLTLIIFAVLPPVTKKYELKLLETEKLSSDKQRIDFDINNDGRLENIYADFSRSIHNITVYSESNIIFQYFLSGNLYTGSSSVISIDDTDGNKYPELYFFSQLNDSVFLNVLDLSDLENDSIAHKEFVALKKKSHFGEYDYEIQPPYFSDTDFNGFKEFIFPFSSGFTYTPRFFGSLEYATKTYKNSEISGMVKQTPDILKIPPDKAIITSGSFRPRNYEDRFKNIPYPDTTLWFSVYDNNLKYLFPPVGEKGDRCYGKAIMHKKKLYYIVAFFSYTKGEKSIVKLIDADGEVIKEKEVPVELVRKGIMRKLYFEDSNDISSFFAFSDAGFLMKIDSELNIHVSEIKTHEKKPIGGIFDILVKDIDGNGSVEFVISTGIGLLITDEKLNEKAYYPLQTPAAYPFYFIKTDNREVRFNFCGLNHRNFNFFSFKKNPFYFIRFLIWAASFGAFWLIIRLSMRYRLKKLEQDNLRLNKTVEERTHKIIEQNIELEKQYKRLEQLDTFKQDMSSMLVHDLKNSLHAVKFLAQNDEIKQAADNMSLLVNNLMDVHKLEEARFKIQKTEINCREIVEEVLSDFSFIKRQKYLNFQNDINEEYFIYADETLFRRIMANLISNACKYAPSNSTVLLEGIAKAGMICISVNDSGKGVKPGFEKKIFEKFRHYNESGNQKSTGLGLTFCKLAADAMKGKISMKNRKPKGSSFSICLQAIGKPEKPISKKLNQNKEKPSTPAFTQYEKEQMLPLIKELKNCPFYDISRIRQIIKQSELLNKPFFSDFLNAVETAALSGNKRLYEELLDEFLK